MTKKQKIWLAVFGAMFLVPEIINPEITVILFYWLREICTGTNFKIGEPLSFNFLKLSSVVQEFLFFVKLAGLLFSIIGMSLIKTSRKILKFIAVSILTILLMSSLLYMFAFVSFGNLP